MNKLREVRTASRLDDRQLRYRNYRRSVTITQQSSSSASSAASSIDAHYASPDYLVEAYLARGAEVALKFEDGHTTTVNLADLGIDTTSLRLETVHASSWGSAIEIENLSDGTFHIDSAVLRAYSDPHYAKQLEQDIAALEANRPGSETR